MIFFAFFFYAVWCFIGIILKITFYICYGLCWAAMWAGSYIGFKIRERRINNASQSQYSNRR